MCTAISYRRHDHYFGRTLDVEFTFNEKVIITPRNYHFRTMQNVDYQNTYAIIGSGIEMHGIPFYYEGVNEKGLSIAGLNFPGNVQFNKPIEGKDNLLISEIIPWTLSHATSIDEARKLFENINVIANPDPKINATNSLHFMISDKSGSIVAESTSDHFTIYENPFDVMTNNPPFAYHLWNMNHYLNLSPNNENNRFSDKFTLNNDGVGMGAYGLPGDTSSTSRFVRASFNLANSSNEDTEDKNIAQFFHILDSVSMVRGCTLTPEGKPDITLYSCCINTDKGIFYYKTYDNNQINAVRMSSVDLDSDHLYIYNIAACQNINYIN